MIDKTDVGLKRNNHFVPRFYLKNWGNGEKVWNYELLVPHEKYPVWRNTPISHTASIDDLYVRFSRGEETDDLEDKFFLQYEETAKDAFFRACNDERLSVDDWHRLIEYIAFQIFRTPTYYQQCYNLCMTNLEKYMKTTVDTLNSPDFVPIQNSVIPPNEYLPIHTEIIKGQNGSKPMIEISAVVGKGVWFFGIENNMKSVAPRLHTYKWSILNSAPGVFWPTSDNPVIHTKSFSDGSITFNGGLGRNGTEIIFPITPTKAIYTRVGHKSRARLKLDVGTSIRIKNLIVGNALRNVFSAYIDDSIPQIRPRSVNLEMFQEERKDLNNWYNQYKEVEVPLLPKE